MNCGLITIRPASKSGSLFFYILERERRVGIMAVIPLHRVADGVKKVYSVIICNT